MNRASSLLNLSPRALQILVIAGACVVALALGYFFAGSGFQIRELAIFGLGIAALLLVLMPSDRVLEVGFGLWVLTFGLGWRTVYFTDNLNVHPSEVLAWLLFVLLLVRGTTRGRKPDFKIPMWIPVLVALAVLGLIVALASGTAIDVALEEFKVIPVIVPIYYIVQWMIRDTREWERTANLAVVIGVYLGCLGMLDSFAPGLASRLSGVPVEHVVLGSLQGFNRVLFSLFGAPLAGAVILTLMCFTVRQVFRPQRSGAFHLLMGGALAIQVFGVYISGYRVTTFGMALLFGIYALFERRALIVFAAAAALLPFLPGSFIFRMLSIFDPQYEDTSQEKRITRAQGGLEQIWSSPVVGHGWGGVGYVHSDLIQLAGNLGLPALFIFLGWFGVTLADLRRLTKLEGFFREWGAALFAGVAAALMPLAGEGLIEFIQLMIPVWFLLSMAHRLTELARRETVQAPGLEP